MEIPKFKLKSLDGKNNLKNGIIMDKKFSFVFIFQAHIFNKKGLLEHSLFFKYALHAMQK